MFEHLAYFDVILVTGPQRSGTTICAKMVAEDTGHTLVDESEYGVHDEAHWQQIVEGGGLIVVHCPAMCHKVHQFAKEIWVAVIFLRRELQEIIASQERINWTQREEPRELAKYGAEYGPIALVKYDFWERVQRDQFPADRRLEVEYESLAEHPLWIPAEERGDFGHRQIR
jgi:hypothetical protein